MLIPFIVALSGTSILNIGFFLQKSQALNLPKLDFKNPIGVLRGILYCRKWLLGTFFTFLGWSMFIIALSLAPLSLIAPLQNIGVILLAALSIKFFHERFHLYEWFGLSLCLFGVFLLTVGSDTSFQGVSTYNSTNGTIMIFILVLSTVILIFGQKFYFSEKNGVVLGFLSGMTAGLGAMFTKLIILSIYQFFNLIFFVICFLICQIISFITLQAGFQNERALIIVPLFNSLSTLIPILAGIFIFYELITVTQGIGILFILIGTSLLFKFSNIEGFVDQPSKES
ncbi:MAG: DMT family transporter [Candidatus Hodarchaeales archaeon]